MKASEKIKKGITIEYKNGKDEWVEAIVLKESSSSLWFKGMGYASLRKTTFDNHPQLYRIKQ